MKGKVNSNKEAVVRLQLRGPGKHRKSINAIIDTGYNGTLTLPKGIIRGLRLQKITSSTASLADGSTVPFNIFAGVIRWHGKQILIDIDEAETEPLVGMELLTGYELNVRVRHNGAVCITPLP